MLVYSDFIGKPARRFACFMFAFSVLCISGTTNTPKTFLVAKVRRSVCLSNGIHGRVTLPSSCTTMMLQFSSWWLISVQFQSRGLVSSYYFVLVFTSLRSYVIMWQKPRLINNPRLLSDLDMQICANVTYYEWVRRSLCERWYFMYLGNFYLIVYAI